MEKWHIGNGDELKVYAYLQDVVKESDGKCIFCFDYFDTIVTRSVIPERTKVIAANQLSDLIGNQLTGEEIYTQRQLLEIEICELNASKGFDPEFNIEQLAEKLFSFVNPTIKSSEIGYDRQSFIKSFIDIEIAVEKMVQKPNPEVTRILHKLKEDDNTIILVSDFYLPAKYLRIILEEKHLLSCFDHLFISCDFLFTKNHSSKLYQVIQDKLGCEAGNMLMVGDNPHADIHAARVNGLKSLHVINREQQEYYTSLEATGTVPEVKFQQSLDRYKARGLFSEMAPSLWLFIHRLVKRLQQEAIKDVIFFSKEGELIKALFDHYQECVFGGEKIKSHYLLVSRKSTFLASLSPLPQEDFSRIFSYYRDISLGDFLLSLNFGLEWSKNLCRELRLPFNKRFDNLRHTEEFNILVSAEPFQDMYEKSRKAQKHNFLVYLNSHGIDYQQNGLTVVDVGWKGSIQDNLFFILEGVVKVHGFFLGSLIASQTGDKNIKEGLLFYDKPAFSPFFDVYNNNRSLYEVLLGASHGSADGYFTQQEWEAFSENTGRVIRERVVARDKKVLVATLDLPEERELFNQTIEPIQSVIKEACENFTRCYLECEGRIPDARWFARQHARMVFMPSKEELELFKSIYHFENFGNFEFTKFNVEEKPGVLQRLHNLFRVITNRQMLETHIWPPVMLSRLGIEPYRYIDGALRMRRNFN